MSDGLLDQADALMRRRSFVAGTPVEPDEFSSKVVGPADDAAIEDVPVLTDVVGDAVVAQNSRSLRAGSGIAESEDSVALRFELTVRQCLEQLLVDRQALLAREIEAWLDEQMPQMVIRAMDGITDHLVALLANRVKDELLPRLEAALSPPDATDTDSGDKDD